MAQLNAVVVDIDELEEAPSQDSSHLARGGASGKLQSGAKAPVSLAAREVLALPVRLLAALPLPTTALCRAERVAGPIVLTTSKAAYTAARRQRRPVFVGGELVAVGLAAEHDRLVAGDVVRWCERKAAEPEWRLGPEAAHGLGLAGRGLQARGWALGAVLAAGGVELLDVGVGDPEGLELVEGAPEPLSRAAEPAGHAADGEAP